MPGWIPHHFCIMSLVMVRVSVVGGTLHVELTVPVSEVGAGIKVYCGGANETNRRACMVRVSVVGGTKV